MTDHNVLYNYAKCIADSGLKVRVARHHKSVINVTVIPNDPKLMISPAVPDDEIKLFVDRYNKFLDAADELIDITGAVDIFKSHIDADTFFDMNDYIINDFLLIVERVLNDRLERYNHYHKDHIEDIFLKHITGGDIA